MKSLKQLSVAAMLVLGVQSASALPVTEFSSSQTTPIVVLYAQYSTTLSTTDLTTTTIQQTTSTKPLATELQVADLIYANATADTFSVSTAATAFIPCIRCSPRAHATAETSLSFRVLQDTTALLTFEGGTTSFTSGFFSLFDQTTGVSLFSQDFTPITSFASIAFNGSLVATHIYDLTLRGDAGANQDGWSMSLGVVGLEAITPPVPEPSTYALMLAGLAAVAFAARRRKDVEG